MSKGGFIALAIVLFVLVFGGLIIGGIIGTNNHAIELEEKIEESIGNIGINKTKALSQLTLIAEAIDSSDEQYLEVIAAIADARDSDAAPEQVQLALNVIMEAYPDEPGNASLYKEQITAITVATEELFRYRALYNSDVKEYNTYTRKFPNTIYLSITGYEVLDYEYLESTFDETNSDIDLG